MKPFVKRAILLPGRAKLRVDHNLGTMDVRVSLFIWRPRWSWSVARSLNRWDIAWADLHWETPDRVVVSFARTWRPRRVGVLVVRGS